MKFIRKLLLVAIGVIIWQAGAMQAVAAPTFDLPAGTPGRQVNEFLGIVEPDTAYKVINGQGAFCEHVIVPGTDHHIYFPMNGVQPTTREAGQYSGARIADDNVTDWYVRAFGGDTAVALSNGGNAPAAIDAAPQMGFKENGFPAAVIRMEDSATADFERQFWQTFRTIASDPVGRVLLYRILIEIRRKDQNGQGSCENQINPRNNVLNRRNKGKSIVIKCSDNESFSFTRPKKINFDPQDVEINTLTIDNQAQTIYTHGDLNDTLDIGLFHEMLHWFHYLRHPQRYTNSKKEDPKEFKLMLRCYYGNQSELSTWGEIDDEEIMTILGSPNYNKEIHLELIAHGSFLDNDPGRGVNVRGEFVPFANRFLEGDDLSENAYRMSKDGNGRRYRMRFGHGEDIEPVSIANGIPNRFRLAHLVATDCYQEITGQAVANWRLVAGEAAQYFFIN